MRELIGDPKLVVLTKRETDVFELLASGMTDQQIADTLYLSKSSIKSFTSAIYIKIGAWNSNSGSQRDCNTRVVAARWWWRNVEHDGDDPRMAA